MPETMLATGIPHPASRILPSTFALRLHFPACQRPRNRPCSPPSRRWQDEQGPGKRKRFPGNRFRHAAWPSFTASTDPPTSNADPMENQVPNVDIAAATATTPKLRRSVEDQAIENYIRDSEQFLEAARVNPDISERLAEFGFDDEELARGMALQNAAWTACRSTHGEEGSGGTGDLTGRVLEAREEFSDFRLVARAAFQSLSDRVALRVVGDPPDDLQRFITAAYAGYDAAAEEPYAAKLTKRGFPQAKLDTLRQTLDTLAKAGSQGIADAPDEEQAPDTGERDTAYNELKEYMKEVKGVSRAAFRKQPEVLGKLGL